VVGDHVQVSLPSGFLTFSLRRHLAQDPGSGFFVLSLLHLS